MQKSADCHLQHMVENTQKILLPTFLFQRACKFFRKSLKKRLKFIWNRINRFFGLIPNRSSVTALPEIQPGDFVRIKTRKEIFATLDNRNRCGQVTFDDGMWAYCGTTQRVFKIVNKFIDENKWIMRKANNCVLLENVICNGKSALGQCDRSCFYFWRKEWLEKIE